MGKICAPVQASPSPPPGCRRSRPGRPFATWSTGSLDNDMVERTGAVAPRSDGSSDTGARGCAVLRPSMHPTRLFHIPRRTRTPTLRPTDNPSDALAKTIDMLTVYSNLCPFHVKSFGCRPIHGLATRMWAGVRSPQGRNPRAVGVPFLGPLQTVRRRAHTWANG